MPLKLVFDKGSVLRKRVRGWQRDLRDLRWAWPEVAKVVEKVQARNFDREGALSDGGWLALDALTAKARFFGWDVEGSVTGAYSSASTEHAEGRILHWTHTLRKSLTMGKANYAIRTFQKRKMIFGTSAPHARPLNDGRSENLGTAMPPRPILAIEASKGPVTKAMKRAIVARFNRQ